MSASRRKFIRDACTASAGMVITASARGQGNRADLLRIGLIGCGGRGNGAAANALKADANTRLVAMADMFPERLKNSAEILQKNTGDQFAVEEDHRFTGFEAYQQLLSSDVEVVLLATPPHFRPAHLKAAIEAGKHVFAEKPVAVDAPGVRSVLDSCELAKKKGLSVVSGLMLRYSKALRETMDRIHGGQLGHIVTLQANYNIGGTWLHERQPQWTDMEWQLRNWYYFTWLCGDHIVEQHVHGLDLMAWAMQDQYPVKCFGLGGRQARTDPKYGHIYDHHAVCYEFAGGQRCFSFCRQQNGTDPDTSHLVFGEKGVADLSRRTLTEGDQIWRYSRARGGDQDLPYQQEHEALFRSIRANEPVSDGEVHGEKHPHGDHGPHGDLHREKHQLGTGLEFKGGPDPVFLFLRPLAGSAGCDTGTNRVLLTYNLFAKRLLCGQLWPMASVQPRHRRILSRGWIVRADDWRRTLWSRRRWRAWWPLHPHLPGQSVSRARVGGKWESL